MPEEVASAFVSLKPSARGFGSQVDKEIGGDLDTAGKRSGKRLGTALKVGALGILGGAALGAHFVADALGEARESQKVGAITANVIKTTGGAAKVSAKQVGELSTSISNKTGIDDEAIQSASNLLLTFTNVRNEVGKGNAIFDEATQAATDMGAALGKDPKAAAVQLGKALNDPTKGITALSKAGVSFTDGQKAQIKAMQDSGNILGAQKIVLGELKKEFSGTAAAASTSGEKATVAFGNLKEQVGTALLPTVDKLQNVLTTKIIPAVSEFFTQLQTGKGAGGQVVSVLKTIGSTLVNVGGFLAAHKPLIIAVAAAYAAWRVVMLGMRAVQAVQLVLLKAQTVGTIQQTVVSKAAAVASKVWAAGQWLLNAALTANPIGLIVAAIALLVVGFILAFRHSAKFRAIIAKVGEIIKSAAGKVRDFVVMLAKKFGEAVVFVATVPAKIAGALLSLGGKLAEKAKEAFLAFFDAEKRGIIRIVGFVKSVGGKILGAIGNLAGALGGKAKDAFLAFIDAEKRGIVRIVGFVKGIGSKILSGIGNVGRVLYDKGKSIVGGLIEGIKAMAGKLARFVKDFVTEHIPGPVAKVLGISSPSKVMAKQARYIPLGMVKGIEGQGRNVDKAMTRLSSRIAVHAPTLDSSVTAGGSAQAGAQELRGTLGIDRQGVAYIHGVARTAVQAGKAAREAALRNEATGAVSFA